jgi:transposase
MNLDLTTLPVDVDALHRMVRELAAQVVDDDAQLAAARAEVERLRLIIQRLQRTEFGRRPERLDGDQLALGLEDLDADIARAPASDRTVAVDDAEPQPVARRQALPNHLLREDVAIDLDERVCPCCGGARWATVCSLIATAKLNDVEPFAYLRDVLERMTNGHSMSRIDDLLPWK